MKLLMPKNIYTQILASLLNEKNEINVLFKEASLISKSIEEDDSIIGLVPSLDLINHKSFFVSSKIGISFDGILSNSYFYLSDNRERTLGKVFIHGDVSLNEIILTKILFKERFSTDIEINLDTQKVADNNQNVLIVGDENIFSWEFGRGLSFSDQIAEILDLPYVNFIFASHNKNLIEQLEDKLVNIDAAIEERFDAISKNLEYDEQTKNFIKENINTVYYEITPNEVEALQDLLKLVYYHGIISEMIDVKFV